MKHKYIFLCAIALLMCMTSCLDNSFLDRSPIASETEASVFTSYDNFKMYAWGFYSGTTAAPGLTAYQNYPQSGDASDMMFDSNSMLGLSWVRGSVSASTITASNWAFVNVRNINIMLDNIDGSLMNEADKNHWRSVGYFFRAHAYFELVKKFGGVPWAENVVKTGDTELLYAPQDSREFVANKILENLLYAEQNIYVNGDGANTVNQNVVRALISRFGLFEGTWRKYHGSVDNVDGTKYFEASVRASQSLIDQNLGLMSNYDDVFNSLSLSGQKSILLYREYVEQQTGMGHDLSQRTRGEKLWEGSKRLIEHYLCNDGRPISTSAVYDGDNTVYDEFRNRDYRLYYTFCPPYRINTNADQTTWEHTGDPVEREYIDFMETLVGGNKVRKMLPVLGQAGKYTNRIPNFTVDGNGMGTDTRAGYYFYKYYNDHPGAMLGERNGTDGPIFRMGEVLINHAEAMFELGRFNQTVADVTVNQLRARAGVTAMQVGEIGADFDAYRDADVDPVLWEIRRERCVELMGSGFRFEDVKRWKKGEYLSLQPVGVRVNDLSYYDNDPDLTRALYDGVDQSRYKNCVTYTEKPVPGWEDKCYLYPIPLRQTVLNENLIQNPGWE